MMASMLCSNKKTDTEIARVRAILDRAHEILSLDDTDALFEEASLFLELEPTPIGPNVVVPTRSVTTELSNEAFPSMLTSMCTTRGTDDTFFKNTMNESLSMHPVALASSMMRRSSTSQQDHFVVSETHTLDNSIATRPPKRQRLCNTMMMTMMRCSSMDSLETSFFQLTAEEEFAGGEDGTVEGNGSSSCNSGVESNSVRPYQVNQWRERFQDLVNFKSVNGHCLVPHKFPQDQQLAQWVKRQRYQYKLKSLGRRSTMTDDRQTELEEIGFVWDSHMAAWYERLESLKEFRSLYGHCNVPSNYELDRQLAVWVKCQRRQMKLFKKGLRTTLSHDRFVALEELGFDWNPRNIS